MSAPFFVLEGLDGAGTTTQTQRLIQRFTVSAQPALATREPSDGPIGVTIRQMLSKRIGIPTAEGGFKPMTRQTLALMFAADRLDHLAATVDPALEAGKVVISDRYYHSSLAYQGDVELVEGAERVDYDWVYSLNSRARVPAMTFFLEIDVEESLRRLSQRGGARDIYETREKLERLVLRYDEVMTWLHSRGQPIMRLDAKRPVEDLHEEIWSTIERLRER